MGIIIPWCSSRLFPLDRKYAKEILNSIGQKQAVTDKERAQIAMIGAFAIGEFIEAAVVTLPLSIRFLAGTKDDVLS